MAQEQRECERLRTATAADKARLRAGERELEAAAAALQSEGNAVRTDRADTEAQRRRVTAEVTQLRSDVARQEREHTQRTAALRAQQEQLRRARTVPVTLPAYWSQQRPGTDGFALTLLKDSSDAATLAALRQLLQGGGNLACAWRLEHPALWERYVAGRNNVLQQVQRLRREGRQPCPGLPPTTARAAANLPGQLMAEVRTTPLPQWHQWLNSLVSPGRSTRRCYCTARSHQWCAAPTPRPAPRPRAPQTELAPDRFSPSSRRARTNAWSALRQTQGTSGVASTSRRQGTSVPDTPARTASTTPARSCIAAFTERVSRTRARSRIALAPL